MIKFEDIHPDVASVLKEYNIPEENIKSRYSDLLICCTSYEQALNIRSAGIWEAMSSVFKGEVDSKIYVEIPLGYSHYYIKRQNNEKKQKI